LLRCGTSVQPLNQALVQVKVVMPTAHWPFLLMPELTVEPAAPLCTAPMKRRPSGLT
jgi:hypothetical protein